MEKSKKINAIVKCILLIIGAGVIKIGLESLLDKITIFKENVFLGYLVSNLVLGLLLVIFMCYVKRVEPLKFNKNNFLKGLKISLVLIISFLVMIVSSCITYTNEGHNLLPLGNVLTIIIAMFAVGFFEEILFRGIVLNYILDAFGRDTRKNVIMSILIGSLLFGFVHVTNVVFMGTSISTAAFQAMLSFFCGLGYGAIYVRCKSLYSTMFVHGLQDIMGYFSNGAIFGISQAAITSGIDQSQIGTLVAFGIINVIMLAILLRKSKSPEYLGNDIVNSSNV